MHDFFVPKTGHRQLDMCHAYGVGLFLAYLTKQTVHLVDTGIGYSLHVECEVMPVERPNLLEKILAIPTDLMIENMADLSLCWRNFDGLLAVTFTSLGKRIFSVSKMVKVLKANNERIVLKKKATKLIKRLTRFANKQPNWITTILADYRHSKTIQPAIIDSAGNSKLNIPMTVEPLLSFGSRERLSQHAPHEKSSISLLYPTYGPIMVYLGAARLLRAQQLPSKLVQFYLPIYDEVAIHPHSSEPLLKLNLGTPDAAALCAGIRAVRTGTTGIKGFSYQTLQTQGAQQSISIGYGYVDIGVFNSLKQHDCLKLLDMWYGLLHQKPSALKIEKSNLTYALKNHSAEYFEEHLWEMAQLYYGKGKPKTKRPAKSPSPKSLGSREKSDYGRQYNIKEIQVILMNIDPDQQSPLAQIIGQKKGTIRFARALKSISEAGFKSDALNMKQNLLSAQNCDELLETLTEIGQYALVSKGISEYVTVPNTDDLQILLNDVERLKVSTVARLIVTISVLYSPKKPKNTIGGMVKETDKEATASDETIDLSEE